MKKTSEKMASLYSVRVFWSSEDEGFIAVCPELQDVSAFGTTEGEAMQELRIAIEMTLETYLEEGWEVPEPAAARRYSGQFRVRLPKRLHRWLVETAEEEGVSLNTCVTMILSAARGQARAMQQYWTPTAKPLFLSSSRPASVRRFRTAVAGVSNPTYHTTKRVRSAQPVTEFTEFMTASSNQEYIQ